jgi:hypothetical protein
MHGKPMDVAPVKALFQRVPERGFAKFARRQGQRGEGHGAKEWNVAGGSKHRNCRVQRVTVEVARKTRKCGNTLNAIVARPIDRRFVRH